MRNNLPRREVSPRGGPGPAMTTLRESLLQVTVVGG